MIDFEKILKLKGKSKADLARFLEITPNNVNRTIKNGRITFSQIENVCAFCEISIIDALRVSGYEETPGEIDRREFIDLASDAFSAELLKLFKEKVIAPYSLVEGKEAEIRDLNREIGKLETLLKRKEGDK